LKMQVAKRVSGSELPLPAVVNWKLNHYGALLQAKGDRYLLVDPTFGTSQWILQDAVAQETSGYFLVPAGPLPAGWVAVADDEAKTVWGRGYTNSRNVVATTANDPKSNCSGGSRGMAVWNVHTMLDSLNISDIPLAYYPPVGPSIVFSVNYDAKEENQPATINYSNLGPLWNFSWASSITFDTANAYVQMGTGGSEVYSNFDTTTQSYGANTQSEAVLVEVSATDYERRAQDGSKLVFGVADGSGRIYLTQIWDAQGNKVTLSYDANFRLVGVTDAIGQVSTLTYGSNTVGNALFYLVTQVTDPFGRSASFSYNGSGQLTKITDEIGISSQFAYGTSDFISTLTTPYGSTTFTDTVSSNGNTETFLANEPNGAQQRLDVVEQSSVTPDAELPAVVPAGMTLENVFLEYRNSYYWDRKAMHDAPGDYTKAQLTHFLHSTSETIEGTVVESAKDALENRVWYHYQNQTGAPNSMNVGMLANPIQVGRVLDDGTTQLYQYTYNSVGYPTQSVDSLGRTTNYTYAANGIDLLTVAQVTGASTSDLLATYTWNSQHEPLTYTDASGETTYYTYNPQGQLTSVTNAKSETTTLSYNSNGYLTSVQGPLAGPSDLTTFTYDSYGRVQTVTDGEGYSLTYAYDALDRVTTVTYPDGTTSKASYTYLDKTQDTDRLTRVTKYTYNGLRQLTSVTDPASRLTQFQWCSCGALKTMIDPAGRATHWDQDVEGRPISKTYADGSSETYAYESTTSRLKSVTDEKLQSKIYSYNRDDTTASIAYANTQVATPGVTFAYDPNYNRLLSMTDGIGTTAYTYNPVPASGTVTPGANQVAQVTGPWPNSTVAYSYDPLGRVLSRSINGTAQTVSYDVLGRVPTITNALGAFNYTYENASSRITNVAWPNGQKTTASYYGNTGDRRLQQLTNVNVNSSTLSQFTYAYNAVGDITTWGQQTDSNPATSYTLSYDPADQLTGATAAGNAYSYAYDPAGNRKTQTVNGTTTTASYNALNEIQAVSPALGNDKTYTWDGEDRLVGIAYTGTNQTTQLSYDGQGRCAQIVEMSGTTVTSTKRFVWCRLERCEVHDANNNVTGRYFAQGEQINGANYYYSRDHLGSIREMTDSSGNLEARYSYDPYGTRTKVSGSLDASLGFTGHYYHAPSGLHLAPFRAYDAQTARWISRDPIGESGGINLQSYVSNDPVNLTDHLGLEPLSEWAGGQVGGFITDSIAKPATDQAVSDVAKDLEKRGVDALHAQEYAAYGNEVLPLVLPPYTPVKILDVPIAMIKGTIAVREVDKKNAERMASQPRTLYKIGAEVDVYTNPWSSPVLPYIPGTPDDEYNPFISPQDNNPNSGSSCGTQSGNASNGVSNYGSSGDVGGQASSQNAYGGGSYTDSSGQMHAIAGHL